MTDKEYIKLITKMKSKSLDNLNNIHQIKKSLHKIIKSDIDFNERIRTAYKLLEHSDKAYSEISKLSNELSSIIFYELSPTIFAKKEE